MKIGNLEVYGIIYKIENFVNGKVYIGQTINGFDKRYPYNGVDIERVYNYSIYNKNNYRNYNDHLFKSIKKYGFDSFQINKVFDMAFSQDELNIKEQCWIKYYNSANGNYGYNNDEGGNSGIPNNEARENMRNAQIKIPIIQLDLKGNLINEWSGAREVSKKLNINQSCIWECLNKGRKTYKGYIWIYKTEYYELNKKVDLDFYTFNKGQKIEIVQFDFQRNIIKVWDSALSIEKETNGCFDASTIIKVCKHKLLSSKEYIFLYNKGNINEEFINHINIYNKSHKKKVVFQLYDNKLIKIWKSVKEMVINFNDTSIYNKLNENKEILKDNIFTYEI